VEKYLKEELAKFIETGSTPRLTPGYTPKEPEKPLE
jgi:hypothetical protein